MQSGYTFVELVVVLVLVGILAAFAVPRLAPQSQFDLAGYQLEFAAGLRYGRRHTASPRASISRPRASASMATGRRPP